jgi:predicted nucleic acid-binding protein
MRIYLDTCTIQRPVDDSEESRVVLEAAAVLELLSFVQAGEIDLVGSAVLQIEHDNNPDPLRRTFTEGALALANEVIEIDAEVEQLTAAYQAQGVKGRDAAHLACAVLAGVDFICTCDDRFLRRARRMDTGLTRAVTPLELIQEVKR